MRAAAPPAISVCIPTYDRASYLAGAIESVLAQTRGDFEIIVSDDASTDDTPAVVARYRDPRIRYVRHDRRAGIAANRNRCLALARGRYVAWLDSDDVYHPTMLERQAAVLDRRPAVALVHGGFHVIDETGRRLPDWPRFHDADTVVPGATAFAELTLANHIAAPTVMARRTAHDRAGPYEPALGRASTDWDMWLRLVLRGDLAYTAAVVASYRYHPRSISALTVGTGERLRCDFAVLRHVFRRDRGRIEDASRLERRARAALAARALLEAGDAFTAGRRLAAVRTLLFATRVHRHLSRETRTWSLFSAMLSGREYATHVRSRALLRMLLGVVGESRFAARYRNRAEVDPAWNRELAAIAATVRRIVPRNEGIAVIDKHDPTLLHLSGRRGWHFPDRRLMPGGYPRRSEGAIGHLEELAARGARYLIVPSAAFWWLDHYAGLREHLERGHDRVWSDARCIVYRIGRPGPGPASASTARPATRATGLPTG